MHAEDIVAVNALYRPGPLIENIPHFIARKHGQERIALPDESLQPILGPTGRGYWFTKSKLCKSPLRWQGFL